MKKRTLYDNFKKYEVQANNLRDFCDKYHNYDYPEDDYEFHKKDLIETGFTIIDHHDSKTGEIVSYYGKI